MLPADENVNTFLWNYTKSPNMLLPKQKGGLFGVRPDASYFFS